MGNACLRKTKYSPSLYLYSARMKKVSAPKPSSNGTHEVMTSHHFSDDCAINELLEGRMELDVILPDNRKVRMSVERRTPMMDLLVQATTANKINPGGHVIHMWKDKGHDFVHYKPNTPIGSLDANTIYIVPKSSIIDPPVKRMPKMANKPFEQTFRLQVNLPRNQLMVIRVSPKTQLNEVKQIACTEKQLDPFKYQLVHPNRPSQILDLSMQLADYGATEITLMSTANIQANICNSAADLIAYTAREDEKKKKGILSIFSKKKSKGSSGGSSCEGPPGRGLPPCCPLENIKPSLKKRPAPSPPQAKIPTVRSESVSHSRHSSDSSGYHESLVFSDSPDTSSGSGLSSVDSTDSHLTGKLTNGTSKTITNYPIKKRKAPPPPIKQIEQERIERLCQNTLNEAVLPEDENAVPDASPQYEEDEVTFATSEARRTSLSSLGTIDDIENSFEQTIAEAQRVIDMEEELKKNTAKDVEETTKPVNKCDVVALHARLEQDVSKRQIHSEISTAFTSLQLQSQEPQTTNESCIDPVLNIGYQEKEKENRLVFSLPVMHSVTSEESSDEVFEKRQYSARRKSRSKTKRQQKPTEQIPNDNHEDLVKKLDNFTIDAYKSNKDIKEKIVQGKTEHPSLQRQMDRKGVTKSESFNVSREEWIKVRPKKSGYGGPGVRICSFLDRSDKKKKPNDNKVYGLEGSVRGIKGQVRLRCAEITDMGFSPTLKEKSRSMLNLIPENNINVQVEIPIDNKQETLKDSVISLKRAVSEHNLSELSLSTAEEPKSEFAKEQERLQQEYMKLQKEFVVWQKQLMSNHSLLEKECIFPKKYSKQSEEKIPTKTGNLPRTVVKVRESQSLTRRPKSELLSNVTLSTWNSDRHSDYLTLPNTCNIRQSYIENGKIDIKLQDLTPNAKNNLPLTGLRCSNTKTYFKPPEVRSSSTTRQRIPPQVRTEEEKTTTVNKIQNRKERTSRRDSFHKFEKIHSETSQNSDQCNSLKNGTTELVDIRKNKSSTLPVNSNSKENEKVANKTTSKGLVPSYTYFGGSINNNYTLGLDSQNRIYTESWSQKESQQKVQDKTEPQLLQSKTVPPPPPPPPLLPPLQPKSSEKQNSTGRTIEKKQTVKNNTIDVRDELMIEVRNFGGRKGLRRISNPEPSWQLHVFGPASVTKA